MTSLSKIGEDTFILMPKRRTFMRGIADIIDFSGLESRYEISGTEGEADTKAISSDWKAVGHDLETAYASGADEISRK